MRHKFRFVPSVPRHAPKERNATAGGGGRRFDKRRDFAQFLFFFLFHFDSFASISCIRAMKKRGNVCFWTRKLREDIINIGTIFNTYILLIIETLVGYNVQCKMCNIRNWMIVSPLREAPEFARSFLQIFTTTTKFVKKLRRILMKSIPFPKINSVHASSDPKAPFPQNSSFEKKKDAHTSLRGTQPSHLFQIARTRAPRKR